MYSTVQHDISSIEDKLFLYSIFFLRTGFGNKSNIKHFLRQPGHSGRPTV